MPDAFQTEHMEYIIQQLIFIPMATMFASSIDWTTFIEYKYAN